MVIGVTYRCPRCGTPTRSCVVGRPCSRYRVTFDNVERLLSKAVNEKPKRDDRADEREEEGDGDERDE